MDNVGNQMKNRKELYELLSPCLGGCLENILWVKDLEEIRFRSERPVEIRCTSGQYFLLPSGNYQKKAEGAYVITQIELVQLLERFLGYSFYAAQEELKAGYFTIPGGHRIGIAGTVYVENGQVRCHKDFMSLNLRVAKQRKGIANAWIGYLYKEDQILSTLIVAAPGVGKTTFLRDCIRLISDGNSYAEGQTVAVVDERGELGACSEGCLGSELGVRTDVLANCPKSIGMRMLLRSMSPQVVAVDEIGGEQDLQAIEELVGAGVSLLATIHGSLGAYKTKEEMQKGRLKELVRRGDFKRIVCIEKNIGGEREYFVLNQELERIDREAKS